MAVGSGREKVSAGQCADRPVFDSYARLSWNPTTRELEKIDTQHGDNDGTIGRHGGVLGLHLDDGLSAWKAGVRRPGFEALLERARSGVSQGIAVWHVDRLFRQPRDLERLIDLADHGFRVISSHGSRDLSDPDDRYILRIEVAHAARSSDDTSRRIRRRQQRYREEGRRVGGPPGFGFARGDQARQPTNTDAAPAGADPAERAHGKAGGSLAGESSEEPSSGQEGASRRKWPAVPAERVAAERAALQEAVAGLLGGLTSQAEIARGWNAAGLLTVTGQQWTSVSVRGTLMRPVLAGRIEHEGELISRFPGEPIIVERDWLRLRAMIEGRRRGRPPSPRYLGSGVLRCGACGKKLGGHLQGTRTGKTRTGKPRSLKERWVYVCNTQRGGCGMSIDMPGVDRELRSLTVARLSDSRYAAAIGTARSRIDERLGVVNAEIEQIEQVAAALSEKVGRREMSVADFDNSYRFLRADLQPLLEERERLNGGAVAGPTEALSTAEVARQWDDADTTEERRAMLVVAVGADQVRVLPVIPGTRANQFNPDRVVLTPADTPLTGRTAAGPVTTYRRRHSRSRPAAGRVRGGCVGGEVALAG